MLADIIKKYYNRLDPFKSCAPPLMLCIEINLVSLYGCTDRSLTVNVGERRRKHLTMNYVGSTRLSNSRVTIRCIKRTQVIYPQYCTVSLLSTKMSFISAVLLHLASLFWLTFGKLIYPDFFIFFYFND